MIKILLVEDDEHCQLVTLRRLNAISGFKADAVSTLKDAIEKFSSCEYDVVVLDLSLRDSHSSRTVAAMKGQHPNCAIVVLSGYEDPEMIRSVISQSASSYLVKGRDDQNPDNLATAIRLAVASNAAIQKVELVVRQIESGDI